MQKKMQTQRGFSSNQSQSLSPTELKTIESRQKRNEYKKNCFTEIALDLFRTVVNFFKIYRFNDRWDYFLMLVGIIFSIGTGFGLPLFALVASRTIDAFDQTPQKLAQQADINKNYLLIIGFSMLATGTAAFSSWLYLGQRISMKFRSNYLKALLNQKLEFFQNIDAKEFQKNFDLDIKNIKQAAGLKIGALIYIAASFIIAGRIATQHGYFLSLVMIPTLPLLGISGLIFSIFVQIKSTKIMQFYSKAEQKIRQTLGILRTVKQLNGQEYELKIFEKNLSFLKGKIILFSILAGLGAGIFYLTQFLVYYLAFWLGSHCVEGTSVCAISEKQDRYSPGDFILIFFAFFVRLDSMQQLFPSLRSIFNGGKSYEKLFQIIGRQSQIKTSQNDKSQNKSKNSQQMSSKRELLQENLCEIIQIQFQNVTFFSRSEPHKRILNDISFRIDKQITTIKCGHEQKTAIMNLILRLYDPQIGSIFINGIDIKNFDPIFLRKKIGYFGKQFYMINGSIRQNIILDNVQITEQKIWQILQNVKMFEQIKLLKDQLDFQVGFQGKKLTSQLRNKIILARIMLKEPQIFLSNRTDENFSNDIETIFLSNFQNMKRKKLLIYAGQNHEIIKNSQEIIEFSKGKFQIKGNFDPFSQQYQKQIFLTKKVQGNKKAIVEILKNKVQQELNNKVVKNVQEKQISQCMSLQKMQFIEQEAICKHYKGHTHKRLIKYLDGNILTYILGLIVCIISGLLYPIFTILMSDILLDTFEFKNSQDQTSFIRSKINNPIMLIVWIGLISFFVNFFEVFIFSVIAEKMGKKLRIQAFRKILKLPLKWFQKSACRTSFHMNQMIKIDPTLVQNLITNFYSIILKNFASFVGGMIIAFVFQWRTACLGFIVLPMMMISGYLSVIFYRDEMNLTQKDYTQAAQIVNSVILNIRSIKIENFQGIIVQKYNKKFQEILKRGHKRVILCSVLFGLSQLLIFISYTIMFFFGTMFYRDNDEIRRLDLLTAIFAVIWSGWTGGANFIRFPAKNSCKNAAAKLFYLFDQIDEEQLQIQENSKLLTEGIKGNIQFKNVKIKISQKEHFLENFSFKIQEKCKISFLSTSDFGMKPIIDLLFRFETLQEGQILIDNENIKNYDLRYLRSSIGVINKDPIIFNGTLKENIVYNKNEASQESIKQVCALASITSFIEGKELREQKQLTQLNEDQDMKIEWNGLETILDPKKNILSISQKKRLNMARLLLRQPKILFINDQVHRQKHIFDSMYRQALGNVIKNRTSILTPHFKENLQQSNLIIVMEKDKITQVKNYSQLLKNRSLLKKIQKHYSLHHELQ